MTIKFSASRYQLQKSCLGRYHFNYIEKVPVVKTTWPATVMGTSIHSYIENYLGLISNENDIKNLNMSKVKMLLQYFEFFSWNDNSKETIF